MHDGYAPTCRPRRRLTSEQGVWGGAARAGGEVAAPGVPFPRSLAPVAHTRRRSSPNQGHRVGSATDHPKRALHGALGACGARGRPRFPELAVPMTWRFAAHFAPPQKHPWPAPSRLPGAWTQPLELGAPGARADPPTCHPPQQEHRRQGAPEAAGHQGRSQERAGHRRREEGATAALLWAPSRAGGPALWWEL